MSLLEDIKAAMQAQGRKQREVSELLALSQSRVSEIFHGKRRLRLDEAETLRVWLGIGQAPTIVGAKDAQIAEIFDVVLDLSIKMNAVIEASASMSARLASLEVKVAAMAARLDRASIRTMGTSE